MAPSEPHLTTITRRPARTADAALVPCADSGIRQTVRSGSLPRPVIVPDRQQPGQLALRAGVRLQRDRVVAGDLDQRVLQRADQLVVAGRLVGGGERVQPGEFRPADRLHLRGGVELHRARAERDHRPVKRDVIVRQPAQVAQHRGLAAVGGEHRDGPGSRSSGAARPGRPPGRRRSVAAPAVIGASLVPVMAAAAAAMCSSVVVSSQATCTRSGPARYRLIPAARARSDGRGGPARNDHPDGVEVRLMVG